MLYIDLRLQLYFLNVLCLSSSFFFFFNDPATTEIYTLSLHDALPILRIGRRSCKPSAVRLDDRLANCQSHAHPVGLDRKSTRLNSSHSQISYAVFCLKKKKKKKKTKKNKKHTNIHKDILYKSSQYIQD